MLYKRLKQRGAVLTEYIIILAYIAAIASSFTSDNGIVDAAKAAAAIAKEDIIVALGGERPSKNNINYTFIGEAERFKDMIPAMINEIYSTFSREGKLASIKYNAGGNDGIRPISEVKYYAKDGSVITVKGDDIYTIYGVKTIDDFFKDETYTDGRPANTGYLAFDKEGNVIKNLSSKYAGNSFDGSNFYSNLTFMNTNTNKLIEIECDQNGNSPNTFSKVDRPSNNNYE